MKIALPTHDTNIDDHFGHCEYFTIFTVDGNKQILTEEIVESPKGCGCKSNIVDTLSAMGVTTMLAGNIGGGAVSVLNNHGIEVIRGCSGNVKAVTQQWLNGTVADSGTTCHPLDHDCHTDRA
jgi:predicted Fe-Mo cluster-binding NifX family protein